MDQQTSANDGTEFVCLKIRAAYESVERFVPTWKAIHDARLQLPACARSTASPLKTMHAVKRTDHNLVAGLGMTSEKGSRDPYSGGRVCEGPQPSSSLDLSMAVPRISLHPSLQDSINQFLRDDDQAIVLEPLIERRLREVDDQLRGLQAKLAERKSQPNQFLLRQEILSAERQELILLDEEGLLQALDKHIRDGNLSATKELFNRLLDLSVQSGLRSKTTLQHTPEQQSLDIALQSFAKDHERLHLWGSSQELEVESSANFADSEILSALERHRQEVAMARKDDSGRVAEYKLQSMAKWVWDEGRNVPPQAVVDNVGLIRASEAVRNLVNAERAYKVWKRRATRQGLKIKQHFDDDSEFSWSLEEGCGSSITSHSADRRVQVKRARRRGRRHRDNLPPDPNDPYVLRTPPSSALALSLTSASINSGLSAYEQFCDKRAKRIAQWQYIQFRNACEHLEQRSRSCPHLRPRLFSRRLNDWIVQHPKVFRWSNLEQMVRRPRDNDSLASSQEGDFEFWHVPHDPGRTPPRSRCQMTPDFGGTQPLQPEFGKAPRRKSM